MKVNSSFFSPMERTSEEILKKQQKTPLPEKSAFLPSGSVQPPVKLFLFATIKVNLKTIRKIAKAK